MMSWLIVQPFPTEVGGQGSHAASIICKMSKAARQGLVLLLNLALVALR
jgi:hypothetical protein